jgi:hypothetical protein
MDTCPACGESRWKTTDSSEKEASSSDAALKKRVLHKILRYFPVTLHLQRLYMRASISKYMRWHKEGLVQGSIYLPTLSYIILCHYL